MCDNDSSQALDRSGLWGSQINIDHFNQEFNLHSNRENDVIEPEEFRYNPPDYLLFEDAAQRSQSRLRDFGFKDESKIDHEEEFKESSQKEGSGKTVKAHLKSESKSKNEDESGGKQVLSNSERARIARKRKKQYYEDLEKKNKYLEGQIKQLAKEVRFYKAQAQKIAGSSQEPVFDLNDPKNIV